MGQVKLVKIVATVGPACQSEQRLQDFVRSGVNLFRINASHSNPKAIRSWTRRIRRVAAVSKAHVGIIVDLQGPRIRTGKLMGGLPVILERGECVRIGYGRTASQRYQMVVPNRLFSKMVKKNHRVLIDNGQIELLVQKVLKHDVVCKVIRGGILGENKGMNLPQAPLTLPALTAKDRTDLESVCREDIDYVALSFVRSDKDILMVKQYMHRLGKQIPIIAKIEKPQAVQNIDRILKHVDGIMVARGDLGIEMGVERVPVIQKQLIDLANQASVPVITATQMLETMMTQMTPTRAEVSDIANAVLDGTDAVMLSGETAIGKHPRESIHMMSRIIMYAELKQTHDFGLRLRRDRRLGKTPVHAITMAALYAADISGAKSIVVYTRGGKSALLMSKLKPTIPIIVLAPSRKVCQYLSLLRGIRALVIPFFKNTDSMIRSGERKILKRNILKIGDPVVIVSGKQAMPGARYMSKIHRLGER